MNISDLQKYENWKGRSPAEIRRHALAAGGWSRVFNREIRVEADTTYGVPVPKIRDTKVFPEWASRVRNYFNETPVTLKRLSGQTGYLYLQNIKGRLPTHIRLPDGVPQVGIPAGAHTFALTGVVYLDELRKPWFEMNKVGAIYHYAGDVNLQKKAAVALAKYSAIPVFKYISPDGTGGSQELIVRNTKRQEIIGVPGQVVDIRTVTEWNEIYRGSYNYSETVVAGLDEHEYRDVEPHVEAAGFYVNPPPYSPLATRTFPAILPPYKK